MILTYENLGIDLGKISVTDISDAIKIYTSHLSLKDLDKILFANPKISRSCLQNVLLRSSSLLTIATLVQSTI